jgi:hypothetical protein
VVSGWSAEFDLDALAKAEAGELMPSLMRVEDFDGAMPMRSSTMGEDDGMFDEMFDEDESESEAEEEEEEEEEMEVAADGAGSAATGRGARTRARGARAAAGASGGGGAGGAYDFSAF